MGQKQMIQNDREYVAAARAVKAFKTAAVASTPKGSTDMSNALFMALSAVDTVIDNLIDETISYVKSVDMVKHLAYLEEVSENGSGESEHLGSSRWQRLLAVAGKSYWESLFSVAGAELEGAPKVIEVCGYNVRLKDGRFGQVYEAWHENFPEEKKTLIDPIEVAYYISEQIVTREISQQDTVQL